MKRYLTILFVISSLFLTSCKDESGKPVIPAVDPHPKTFIMFGKISSFTGNVSDAGAAVANGALIGGQRIIAYQDRSYGGELFELVQDKNERAGYRKDIIKTYDTTVSCFEPERMRTILEDAMEAAPAEHYGLSVGSHGTGWLHLELGLNVVPPQARYKYAPLFEIKDEHAMTRNVNHELDIEDFSPVLEGLGFDFVLLDQCLMGSIEVAYELRRVAPYLILSPAEIMYEGFPFKRVVPALFSDWNNLTGVCHQFADYYRNSLSCTISLVKTSELEALAESVRDIVRYGVNEVGQAGLQYYYETEVFYDFKQYVGKLSKDEGLSQVFSEQFDRVVVATFTNDKFFPGNEIVYYSGLTTYVPDPLKYPKFYESYQNTAWYKTITAVNP